MSLDLTTNSDLRNTDANKREENCGLDAYRGTHVWWAELDQEVLDRAPAGAMLRGVRSRSSRNEANNTRLHQLSRATVQARNIAPVTALLVVDLDATSAVISEPGVGSPNLAHAPISATPWIANGSRSVLTPGAVFPRPRHHSTCAKPIVRDGKSAALPGRRARSRLARQPLCVCVEVQRLQLSSPTCGLVIIAR